jgi:glutaredoxin
MSFFNRFLFIVIYLLDGGDDVKKALFEKTKQNTVPNIFIQSLHVGGYDSLSKANTEGRLMKMIEPSSQS